MRRRARRGSSASDQAAELGQRVVGARQHPREVERQDAVALVAPEQLGCLGGAEQHDQDADDPVVGGVADRRGVLELAAGRARLRGERREPDREDGRQERQAGEHERRDLGPPAATDPEAGPERLREERDGPRCGGRAADRRRPGSRGRRCCRRDRSAEVGRAGGRSAARRPSDDRIRDAACAAVAGTSSRNRSSRLWRRCSRRTSGSPRSAMRVADEVVLAVVGDRDEDRPAVGDGLQPVRRRAPPRARLRPPRPRPRGRRSAR